MSIHEYASVPNNLLVQCRKSFVRHYLILYKDCPKTSTAGPRLAPLTQRGIHHKFSSLCRIISKEIISGAYETVARKYI